MSQVPPWLFNITERDCSIVPERGARAHSILWRLPV